MTEIRRVDVRITGLVQGVFYRDSLRREASRAGVTGWVRNLPDGSVSAQLQGDRELVDRLLAWCRVGPPHARVEQVYAADAEPVAGETGFVVG